MLESAYQTIKKYNMIQTGDFIVIGLSGGADSVSLFHFLCSLKSEYNLNLIAVHIHHGIRGKEADDDAGFVNSLCSKYNVPCEIYKIDLHKEAQSLKMTEEEAGRFKRYQIFNKVLKKYKAVKIAVAHNMNDQAETVIMRIFRGTGLKGLTGIPPIRDNIIRPLIECSRDDIEEYCTFYNLEYKKDYTNDMAIYTRNKIRLQLIPYIEQNFNKSIIKTLSNMSLILKEDDNYIENEANKYYNCCIISQNQNSLKLDIAKLNQYQLVIQKRILRLSIYNLIYDLHDIESIHMESILKLINGETGKKINITNNLVAEKQYKILHIYKNTIIKCDNYCYTLNLDETYINELNIKIKLKIESNNNLYKIPKGLYTKVFDYDKIVGRLKVRNRIPGDKIYLKGIGTKKLKDFFIDIKLPKDKRDIIPLIVDDNNIIWVVGYRTNSFYNIDSNTKRAIFISIEQY